MPLQSRGEDDWSSSGSLTPKCGVSPSDFQILTPGNGCGVPILDSDQKTNGSGRSAISDPFRTPGRARSNAVTTVPHFNILNIRHSTGPGFYPLPPPRRRRPALHLSCNLPRRFEKLESPNLSLSAELTRAGISLPGMHSDHDAGPTGVSSVGDPPSQAPLVQAPQPQAPQMQLSQGHFPQAQNPYVQPTQAYTFPAQAPGGPGPQMQLHPMGYHHLPQGGAFQPVQMSQAQWNHQGLFFTSDQAVGSNVLPFAHLAKDLKPPQWGVIKIENVRAFSTIVTC